MMIPVTILLGLLSFTAGASVELKVDNCPTSVSHGTEQLIRVTNSSRFFIPEKFTAAVSPLEANKLCIQLGLEPAVLETMKEFHELTTKLYYQEDDLNDKLVHFHIDGTDVGKLGIFKSASGKPLPYQAFMLTRGREYFNSSAHCLSITCSVNSDCHYRPRSCEQGSGVPLCQLKRAASCSENAQPKEELQFVGKTEKKVYYGSTSQRNWYEAVASCRTLGLNLQEPFSAEESEEIQKILQKYMEKLDTPMWVGQSWTSGKFDSKYGSEENIISKTHNPESEKVLKFSAIPNWQENATREATREVCLLNVGTNLTRSVLCDLKSYFMCWKAVPASGDTPTDTMALPPSTHTTDDSKDDKPPKPSATTAAPKIQGRSMPMGAPQPPAAPKSPAKPTQSGKSIPSPGQKPKPPTPTVKPAGRSISKPPPPTTKKPAVQGRSIQQSSPPTTKKPAAPPPTTKKPAAQGRSTQKAPSPTTKKPLISTTRRPGQGR